MLEHQLLKAKETLSEHHQSSHRSRRRFISTPDVNKARVSVSELFDLLWEVSGEVVLHRVPSAAYAHHGFPAAQLKNQTSSNAPLSHYMHLLL
jgi:hypothetical protein